MTAPLQGLAAYLRSIASTDLIHGSEAYQTHMQWAAEVDAAQAQQGWVMVPVEPTQEMIDAAFFDTVQDQDVMRQLGRRRAMRDTYAKLIAAAPKEQTK